MLPQSTPLPQAATARDAQALAEELGALPAEAAVALLARRYQGRISLVSSFGTESAVLLHMVAHADPALPVLFLDTGKLFAETLAFRDRLVAQLGLRDVRSILPDPAALAARDPFGGLWAFNPDACCALRKVEPLAAALAPFAVWLNGRKRAHGSTRAALNLVEATEDGRLKVNPLAAWDGEAVEAWRVAHDLPAHPLAAQGYTSVGCRTCTSPVSTGEATRAGRWRGTGKTECGIHFPQAAPRTDTDNRTA
jgi:phosphoadenosine phosphosulfate reductase